MDSLEFERSVSNLINNAAEASPLGSKVIIAVNDADKILEILIKDFGKGISAENLKKIGTKGFSSEKENGTGIGVFYAKRFIEDLGGRLNIESSLGEGTKVSIFIPKAKQYPSKAIILTGNQHLLVLEDQKYLRDAIQIKFQDVKNEKLLYTVFSTPRELERWLATNKADFKLYSDYFLETEDVQKIETGIEVIKRLGIANKSVLFTSAFDNPTVIEAARQIGVSVLSKDQFFEAEVRKS